MRVSKVPLLSRMKGYIISHAPIKCKNIVRSWSRMGFLIRKRCFVIFHPSDLIVLDNSYGTRIKNLFFPLYLIIPIYDEDFRRRNWNGIQYLLTEQNKNWSSIFLYRKTSPYQLFLLIMYICNFRGYITDFTISHKLLVALLKRYDEPVVVQVLSTTDTINRCGNSELNPILTIEAFSHDRKVIQNKGRVDYPNAIYDTSDDSRNTPISEHNNKKISYPYHQKKDVWVAYVIPNLSINGGIIVILEHCFRLIKRGYNVSLISCNESYQDLNWFGENYIQVDTPSSLKNYPDIAVATHWSTVEYVKKLKSARKIYFVQSDETRFSDAPEIKKKIRETYLSPFEYITEARWIQEWLKASFHQPAHYVPNAVNPSFFYPSPPITPKGSKFRVLLEGAINVEYKGMSDAFEVIKNLDCEVWCISSVGKPKEDMRCDRFFEHVPLYQMKDIYSSCDILLKMSRVEGFYGPPLEMMACGGLVVTAKVTGYDEYIVDKENALVVEPRDVEGARRAIQTLMDDSDLRIHLLNNAAITVNKWNDWEKTIDILEQFYYG